MKPIREMTQVELGALVQTHLREKGIDVVLSGGAAVAFYSSGKYVSGDIDFVNRYGIRRSSVASANQEIGFKKLSTFRPSGCRVLRNSSVAFDKACVFQLLIQREEAQRKP